MSLYFSETEKNTPFKSPLPQPLRDFHLGSKAPELYRPARHGPNFVTMGIRKMDWNEWIQMDSYFLKYHELKESELKKDLPAHVQYVDNTVTRDACFELYEELAQFLIHRYPSIFQLDNGFLENAITGERFPFPARKFSLNILRVRFSATRASSKC